MNFLHGLKVNQNNPTLCSTIIDIVNNVGIMLFIGWRSKEVRDLGSSKKNLKNSCKIVKLVIQFLAVEVKSKYFGV